MSTPAEAEISDRLSRTSILLADDSNFMLELMTAMLKAFGVGHIQRAVNGKGALQMIRERSFDLVIADWQMEPMDGLTFVKELRTGTRGAAQRLPVIMCTAYSDKDRVLTMRDAGANEVLTKPVSPAAVYDKMVAVLFHPRPFVVADRYVGPCRRRRQMELEFPDRRRQNLAKASGDNMFL